MKDTATVVIEKAESTKNAVSMQPGSIKFDSSLIGPLSTMRVRSDAIET